MVLSDHLAQHGRTPAIAGPALIEMLRDSGLTGRDSSGSPVHAALTAAVGARRAGGLPVVLARSELSEPASRKDTALLWVSPHLVLDGLQLAALAVGARGASLCVGRQPSERLRDTLHTALADRARAGLDAVPIDLATPASPADPDDPILAANVETLAHVALIARYGVAAFRDVGTAAEPGTMLCTIRQPHGGVDIVEAPIGAPLGDLVTLDDRTQAVLAGGYHGQWLPAASAASLPLSHAGLRDASLRLPGASVGAGVLAALPDDRCGLAETSRVARYLAQESGLGAARFVHCALGVFSDEVRLHEQGRCRAPGGRPFLPVPLPSDLATLNRQIKRGILTLAARNQRWKAMNTPQTPATATAPPAPAAAQPGARRPDGSPIRVLVVDDEPSLAELLGSVLRYEGWETRTAGTGSDAVTIARDFRPDAVILDIMLPDFDGLEVLRRLRAEIPEVCVLFLTARDAVEDRIAGITAGGDDYVTKPFSLEEVLARLRGLLRRADLTRTHSEGSLTVSDLTMDEDAREVRRGGELIDLTATEFELLRFLMRNPRRVLSKAQILDRVWNYDFGGQAHVVELYISYLRKKIDAGRPPLIHTVRGVGYVLKPAS